MISHRYLPAIGVLLLLALIPTIIHSYSPLPSDNERVDTIPADLARFTSVPSDRHAGWGKRRFDTDNWVEREYRDKPGAAHVTLTVVRTFDTKSVYHHPELAVAYGTSFVGETIERLPERPEIPVHVLKAAPGVSAFAAYVLQYETRFVENPVSFQIRAAGEMLVSRRKPMTMFFVFEPAPERDANKSATSVLLAAIDAFNAAGAPLTR